MSPGDSLQRWLATLGKLHIVFAPLEELIKCCMAVAPSVFTVMTLYMYCAYLRKVLALGIKADQEIQRSTVALSSFVCCCECFSNPCTQNQTKV